MNLVSTLPERIAIVGGRALLAGLFIVAGVNKIVAPQPFLDHMTEFGIPTLLLPVVIALQLGAGIALLVGWRVREAAGALGVFCLLTAFIFHRDLANKAEQMLFFEDLAIAGSLFAMAANAAAVDRARRATDRSPPPSTLAQRTSS
jgi:putative oxidoreductase